MSGVVALEGGLVLILSVGRSVPVGSFTDGGFSSDDRFLNGRIRLVGWLVLRRSSPPWARARAARAARFEYLSKRSLSKRGLSYE